MAPTRSSPICRRIAQPVELGSPDGLVLQAVLLQKVVHHLNAPEGEAVGDAAGVGLRRVGEAVRMIAESVEVVARAQEEHLVRVLPFIHRLAIVAAPAIAGALDATHRR